MRLSRVITDELAPHVYSYELGKLKGFVGWNDLDGDRKDYDPDLLAAHLKNDIEDQVYEIILGYTDWLACKLVRNYVKEMPVRELLRVSLCAQPAASRGVFYLT